MRLSRCSHCDIEFLTAVVTPLDFSVSLLPVIMLYLFLSCPLDIGNVPGQDSKPPFSHCHCLDLHFNGCSSFSVEYKMEALCPSLHAPCPFRGEIKKRLEKTRIQNYTSGWLSSLNSLILHMGNRQLKRLIVGHL